MSDQQSDRDQGFLPMKPQITSNKLIINLNNVKCRQNQQNRPNDFLARYICGDGFIKKQPQQVYYTSKKIQQLKNAKQVVENQQIIDANDSISAPKQKQKTIREDPYKKYFLGSNYNIVYSRYKKKDVLSFDNKNFCRNQINLSVLSQYKQQSFSVLKSYQRKLSMSQSKPEIKSILQFDSKFQSGNLLWAFQSKQKPNSYTLFLQNDTNTYGYTQWFYFSVKNMEPNIKYSFQIVNFKKRHSFFKEGKKLAIFSMNRSKNNLKSGWYYGGQNIKYERSCIELIQNSPKFYKLSFELCFTEHEQLIMIAMNLPYSYSRLINNLKQYQQNAKSLNIQWNMIPIAHSIANNAVPYITITNNQNQSQKQQYDKNKQNTIKINKINRYKFITEQSNPQTILHNNNKKIILILARQHPGQTWSSYLMQSIFTQLLSNSDQSKWLLDNFIFKIFPMVNVDGVIYGNFRCDLGGGDLNRKWKDPSKILHPQVFNIRQQIFNLSSKYQIASCLDLHGHSKAYNVFCYSCKTDNVTSRVLPYLISQLNPVFYFPSCTFGIDSSKIKTARAVIFKTIKNPNVLTIQCSFYGTKNDSNSNTDQNKNTNTAVFQPQTMIKLSKNIFQAFICYYKKQAKAIQAQNTIRNRLNEFLDFQRNNKDYGGSQSDPSADQMDLNQKLGSILPKKMMLDIIQSQPLKKKSKIKKRKEIKQRAIASVNRKYYTIQKNNKSLIKPTASTKLDNSQVIKLGTFAEKKSSAQYNPKSTINDFPFKSKKSADIIEVPPPTIRYDASKRDSNYQLPFYIRQETRLMPLKMKKQSKQVFKQVQQKEKQPLNPKFSCFRVSAYKTQLKSSQPKQQRLSLFDQQGLPALCILSDNKKKQHFGKIKQKIRIHEDNSKSLNKDNISIIDGRRNSKIIKMQIPIQNNLSINKKSDRSVEILTKIWRQNLNRYGKQIKSMHIVTKT